jgi:hypothetical protein
MMLALVAAMVATPPAVAQQCLQAPQSPQDLDPNDYFGISVAIDGGHAIVGSVFDDDQGGNSGAAYIYTSPGSLTQKIHAVAGEGGHAFGSSVAIGGDIAALGAPGYPFGTAYGAAYIFRRNGTLPPTQQWTQQGGAITASDGQSGDFFGGLSMGPNAIGVSGDFLVVGAPGAGVAQQEDAGKAYVFRYNATTSTWQERAILAAPTPQAEASFGACVAISGKRAIIGAPGHNAGTGIAFAYHHDAATDAWLLDHAIAPLSLPPGAQFGWSVSIDGTVALIGAPMADRAWLYRLQGGTWAEEQQLTGVAGDQFGYAASLSGSLAVVGAWKHDHPNGQQDAGAAYLFQRQAGAQPPWVQVLELLADSSNAHFQDAFGGAVAIDRDDAFIGAFGEDPQGDIQAGAVYVFDTLPGCP